MKMVCMFLLILVMNGAYAGFNGLTHHSRADCGNNETISWDWTTNHLLKTVSLHAPENGRPMDQHFIIDDWRNTWRSAAVHWGEGHGGWIVIGQHWMKDNRGKEYCVKQEVVRDCSIYDGWWDKDKD